MGQPSGGAYGHGDRLGFYSTCSGKTTESLSCFFNGTLPTYQKYTEPRFNTYNTGPVFLLFFKFCTSPPLGLFEAVPVIRPYLYPIRTSKKLGLYLKFLPVTQDQLSISVYLSFVSERSFIERIVLLIRLLLLYLVDGSLQALLIYKLPFPAFFPPWNLFWEETWVTCSLEFPTSCI